MIDKRRAKLLLIFFASIVIADIFSKWLTNTFLPPMERMMLPYPYGGVALFENVFGISLSLNHQVNTGAAWGLFPNSPSLLLYLRVCLVAVLALYLLLFNKNTRSQIPFTLIIAGAAGNILDTLFYGHVIDMFFIQLFGYDFPVFNIADMFIFSGVVWLCILNLKSDTKKKTQSPSFNHESKPFDPPSFGG